MSGVIGPADPDPATAAAHARRVQAAADGIRLIEWTAQQAPAGVLWGWMRPRTPFDIFLAYQHRMVTEMLA